MIIEIAMRLLQFDRKYSFKYVTRVRAKINTNSTIEENVHGQAGSWSRLSDYASHRFADGTSSLRK